MRIEVGSSTQRKCETMLSTPHIPTDISPRRDPAFMTGGEADAVPGPAQLTAPGHWTLHWGGGAQLWPGQTTLTARDKGDGHLLFEVEMYLKKGFYHSIRG